MEIIPSQTQYVLSMGGNVEERGYDNWWNVIVCQREDRSCSPIYHFLLTECSRASHELEAVLKEIDTYQFKTPGLDRWEKLTHTYGKISR